MDLSGTRAADLEQRRSSGAADLERRLRPHGAHVVVVAGVAASSPAQVRVLSTVVFPPAGPFV